MTHQENGGGTYRHRNGDTTARALLKIVWGILIAIVGWLLTNQVTAQNEMELRLNNQAQRIAVIEESLKNNKESLGRIELGVDELRRFVTQQQQQQYGRR